MTMDTLRKIKARYDKALAAFYAAQVAVADDRHELAGKVYMLRAELDAEVDRLLGQADESEPDLFNNGNDADQDDDGQ